MKLKLVQKYTDERLAYKTIENKGYIHKTVNHSQFFVDPTSGAHTQRIESLWGSLKLRIIKKNAWYISIIAALVFGGTMVASKKQE